MKKILCLLLILLMAVGFSSCILSQTEKAEKCVITFRDSLVENNFDKAKECLSETILSDMKSVFTEEEALQLLKIMMATKEDEKSESVFEGWIEEVLDTVLDDSEKTASVNVKYKNWNLEEELNIEFKLIKEDGKWVISYIPE